MKIYLINLNHKITINCNYFMDLETQIIIYLEKKQFRYIKISDEKSIPKIYNLLINEELFEPECSDEFHYLGFYYQHIAKNYDLMMNYYLRAIELGNSSSMNNLGYHYKAVEDFNLMKKYYLMSLELGNQRAIDHLFNYNIMIQKSYKNLKLIHKYQNIMDHKNIIKVINDNCITKLNEKYQNLFLEIISETTFNPDDNIGSCVELLSKTLKTQISIMDLHFKYSLEGKGFKEARDDFYNMCLSIKNETS